MRLLPAGLAACLLSVSCGSHGASGGLADGGTTIDGADSDARRVLEAEELEGVWAFEVSAEYLFEDGRREEVRGEQPDTVFTKMDALTSIFNEALSALEAGGEKLPPLRSWVYKQRYWKFEKGKLRYFNVCETKRQPVVVEVEAEYAFDSEDGLLNISATEALERDLGDGFSCLAQLGEALSLEAILRDGGEHLELSNQEGALQFKRSDETFE